MPTHWTYEELKPEPCMSLEQGDILEPTDELCAILSEVHPHFNDPKYTGFLMLTQSCDLVLRDGKCNARYLNIAVIRLLDDVLHDLLSKVCDEIAPKVYSENSKDKANMLLKRVFNQNEQALGIFYLHPSFDNTGIAEPSVSLLRVSVSLRAEHYQILQKARVGRLKAVFQNKLGWLIGNLYSRIGTPDWYEAKDGKGKLKKLVRSHLDPNDHDRGERNPYWIKESVLTALRSSGVSEEELGRDVIIEMLEQFPVESNVEIVANEAARVIKLVFDEMSEEDIKRIKNRLVNDQKFGKAVRER